MDNEPRGPKLPLTSSYWPADTTTFQLRDWTLGELLHRTAAAHPARTALVEVLPDGSRGRTWTFAELLRESERVAKALLARFRPGEHVAMWAANVPEWEFLLFGCGLAGMVLVTVNPAYKARELEYVLGKSEAAGLFLMDEYRGVSSLAALEQVRDRLPLLRDVFRVAAFDEFIRLADGATPLPGVSPNDPCVIMFTSGTTGAQKGAIFTHKGIVNNAYFADERAGFFEGGVYINPMPMFHIGSMSMGAVGPVALGGTHVLAPQWDAKLFMSLVEREKGNYSLLVPTMIEALLADPDRSRYDLSSLKNLMSGSAMVEASLVKRTYEELGCTICNEFGQTEMQGVICGVHPDDSIKDKSETIGRPMPHVEVKIADPVTGEILPIGQQGEICARGYQTMLGYFNMPEETAKTLKPDGWLHSGDLGSMDERGYLKITGRIKDMIIRGGENIYPREIENLLLEHPKIAQVAVFGLPDEYWGEQVAAAIIPKSIEDKPAPKELHDFCRASLSSFKTPRFWYFLPELPRTETGKVQKFLLAQRARTGEMELEQQT